MAEHLRALLAANLDQAVFMGRIGAGNEAVSRSLRKTLDQLQAS
jgi:hypothetical protein